MTGDPTASLAAPDIGQLRDLLGISKRAVVFTGAGISTESGIPDFRSPGGVWDKYKPIMFQEFVGSEQARHDYWQRKFESDPVIKNAEPNRGHRAVAALVARGTVTGVITQNIDGLHQLSGIPDAQVIELHGNGTYASCLSCGERYELDPIREAFLADGTIASCETCGGMVKPATISFGQPMPEDAMREAEDLTLDCDLFLAIGTSLVVYPAAGFPVLAKRNGANLVILNREPTDLDGHADLVLNLEIGPTLAAATGLNEP
jgi:NAD-dependent deacetylase